MAAGKDTAAGSLLDCFKDFCSDSTFIDSNANSFGSDDQLGCEEGYVDEAHLTDYVKRILGEVALDFFRFLLHDVKSAEDEGADLDHSK